MSPSWFRRTPVAAASRVSLHQAASMFNLRFSFAGGDQRSTKAFRAFQINQIMPAKIADEGGSSDEERVSHDDSRKGGGGVRESPGLSGKLGREDQAPSFFCTDFLLSVEHLCICSIRNDEPWGRLGFAIF
ncbi:uncharacterized protein LOC115665090 [Syzygium oleosum]|uniref:uncharacterized protein LOC115665090 n=1 Tax=Syzygium oleosum TaxID=219896 RepID=UPI0011D1B4E5|nr:uncharacterized protein LOC115665090 [Syzygium oleosum]